MIKKYNYLKIVFLCCSVLSFGQQKMMISNSNLIDYNFIPVENCTNLFSKDSIIKEDLTVIAKKENDTFFAIYVKNNIKDTLQISCQDSHLFLLQEAKNEKGEWKPIEYWSYSWCGNSYRSRKIGPNEIIKSKSFNYSGSYVTEIRFKLFNNNKVYYSNVLKGTIELSQFMISETRKKMTNYYQYEARAGKEIAEKILFLEPNGLKEYSEKEKAWQKEMAERRKENKTR